MRTVYVAHPYRGDEAEGVPGAGEASGSGHGTNPQNALIVGVGAGVGDKAMKLFHVQFRGKDFYANEHAAGLIIMLYDLWFGGYSTEGVKYDGITPVVDGLRDKPEVVEVEL